jgi:hypothetical protein
MGIWTVLSTIGSPDVVEEDFEPTIDAAFLKPVQNGFGPVGSSGWHGSSLWIFLQSGAKPPWTDEPIDCYRAPPVREAMRASHAKDASSSRFLGGGLAPED